MEFNTLIKAKLKPILQKYGFELAEEFKNILWFHSLNMKFNVVFNAIEQHCLVEIGRQGGALYPLNDKAVAEIFHTSLSVEQVSPEVFVENLSVLIETREGVEMLQGNIEPLKAVIEQQSEQYTSELLLTQALEIAKKAWVANNYAAFVECIDIIGFGKVPQSYRLKYNIAKQQ